jgi:hypothetical protein
VTFTLPDRDSPVPRLSSFCSGGACIGVRVSDREVTIMDTKRPDSEPLRFTPDEWQAFVAGVKAGEFDGT